MRLIQAQNLRRCHYGNSSREAARLTAAPSSGTLTSARATPAGWHLQGCPPHPALSPHVAGTPRGARGCGCHRGAMPARVTHHKGPKSSSSAPKKTGNPSPAAPGGAVPALTHAPGRCPLHSAPGQSWMWPPPPKEKHSKATLKGAVSKRKTFLPSPPRHDEGPRDAGCPSLPRAGCWLQPQKGH